MDPDVITDCECTMLPGEKYYRDTQFSTAKRRSGRESVPFLGLSSGVHKVKFYTKNKVIIRNVKVWLSPYGDAWIILRGDVS